VESTCTLKIKELYERSKDEAKSFWEAEPTDCQVSIHKNFLTKYLPAQ